jgi:hypothetical protein
VTAIDELSSDLVSLQNAASQLVFHYRVGDYEKDGVPKERESKISLRYADVMFKTLLSRGEPSLMRERQSIDKVVDCCRGTTVLFLSLCRHKGIPARGRVGFAPYGDSGWWTDHMVAKVWDEKEGRWRLVDPETDDTCNTDPTKGKVVNWLDLNANVFPRAWQAARAGSVDPDRFVVAPKLEIPILRGWYYLAHNVIHDLTSLTKMEMLLWDA